MQELLRTDNPVLLSWLTARLAEEDIPAMVCDGHTAALYGGALAQVARRVLVAADDLPRARRLLAEQDVTVDADGMAR